MIAGILSALTILKPFLAPLLTFLAGLLFPSPLQKAIDKQGDLHNAEGEATSSRGDVSGLDNLP